MLLSHVYDRCLEDLRGTLRCLHRLLDTFRVEMPHRDLDHLTVVHGCLTVMRLMRMMHLLRVAMFVMHLLRG